MANIRRERMSGRFWLAGAPERTVGGWLDLSGRWPILELAEPLTPAWREVSRRTQPDGSVVVQRVPADDDVQPEVVTVHGHLRRGPTRVTLVDAAKAGRGQIVGLPVPDPGEERLRADYALVGGHVTERTAKFTRARLRFRHLDVWAQLSGIQIEVLEDGSHATVTHESPDEETAELSDPPGRLVLDLALTMPHPTVRGFT